MKSSGEKITPEAFYQQLAQVRGPDLVAFARWVVENAPAHGLSVTWGKVGPLLKFAHENTRICRSCSGNSTAAAC